MRWYHRFTFAVVTLLIAGLLATSSAQAQKEKDKDKDEEPDILYVPTHQKVVDKMLEVCKVTEKDIVYDLSCGDGRIVCTAAKTYKCKAFGWDVATQRIKDS